MHQSLTFSIQWRYVFLNFSGIKRISLDSTASKAGFANSGMRIHHCKDRRGSTTAPVRSDVPTEEAYSSTLANNPLASKSAATCLRAAKRSIPAYCSPWALNVPSSFKTSKVSRPCF